MPTVTLNYSEAVYRDGCTWTSPSAAPKAVAAAALAPAFDPPATCPHGTGIAQAASYSNVVVNTSTGVQAAPKAQP